MTTDTNGTGTGQPNPPAGNPGESAANPDVPQSQQGQGLEGGEGQGGQATTGGNGEGAPGDKPADEGGDKPADKSEGDKAGAPEAYETFTLPEGWVLEGPRLENTVALFKRAGLNQAEAQAEIDRFIAESSEFTTAAHGQLVEKWGTDLKNDPEFGGAGFEANLTTAAKAVAHFGGQQLIDDLNAQGIGNLPSLNKAFLAVQKAIQAKDAEIAMLKGEGGLPGHGAGGTGGEASLAERMYPGMTKKT